MRVLEPYYTDGRFLQIALKRPITINSASQGLWEQTFRAFIEPICSHIFTKYLPLIKLYSLYWRVKISTLKYSENSSVDSWNYKRWQK
jgi:hypothetical protein